MLLAMAIGQVAIGQTLSVADVEVLPGTTASYSITLNVGGGEYTGLQYEIAFPATGFSTSATNKSTVNASWEGGSVNPGDLTAGAGRVSIFSMQNVKLPTGDFALGTVSFCVDSEVELGDYDVTISKIEFLAGSTRKSAPDVTFKVKVTDRITLDEDATTAPKAQTGVNVKVTRSIKANEWSTICLPFAMSADQVKTAFGDDVQLGDFQGYEVKDDGETIGVKFADAAAIEKNHPYIIKVGADVAEFTVDGVDIDPEEEPMINFGTKRKPKAFVGNYVAGTAIENGCLFLSDNKFWYSVGTTTIKGFRGYFNFDDLLPDFEDNYAAARVMMMFDDDVVTGIDASLSSKGEHRYYNLGGQRISHPKKKGLYIQEGKKLIVK